MIQQPAEMTEISVATVKPISVFLEGARPLQTGDAFLAATFKVILTSIQPVGGRAESRAKPTLSSFPSASQCARSFSPVDIAYT